MTLQQKLFRHSINKIKITCCYPDRGYGDQSHSWNLKTENLKITRLFTRFLSNDLVLNFLSNFLALLGSLFLSMKSLKRKTPHCDQICLMSRSRQNRTTAYKTKNTPAKRHTTKEQSHEINFVKKINRYSMGTVPLRYLTYNFEELSYRNKLIRKLPMILKILLETFSPLSFVAFILCPPLMECKFNPARQKILV